MAEGLRIDDTMLPLIRCPATHQTLRMATADDLARLNASIAADRIATVGGEAVSEELVAALIRADGLVVYPVVDGIARLIADDGLKLSAEEAMPAPTTDGQQEPMAPIDGDGNASPTVD